MVVRAQADRLLGRQRERAVLERVLDTARDGHGTVLIVLGDPGVGKTALLEYAVEWAEDLHILRAAGVEGEMELDYAALQQLCAPASRSSGSSRWGVAMRGRCWSPPWAHGWTSPCFSGSSPRRAGTRSRSWSSRAD